MIQRPKFNLFKIIRAEKAMQGIEQLKIGAHLN